MMIEIIRVEEDLSKSKIKGKMVEELPKGLRERLITLLDKFDDVNTIKVGDCAENTKLISNEEVTLSKFAKNDEDLVDEFFHMIRIIRWYWYEKDNIQKGAENCYFCGGQINSGLVCEKCGKKADQYQSMIDDVC